MNYGLATPQLMRLKGRLRLPDVVADAGLTHDESEVVVQESRRPGKFEKSGGRLRLTAQGHEALTHLIAQERLRIDLVVAPGASRRVTRRRCYRAGIRAVVVATMTATMAILLAPASNADPTTTLRSAAEGKRGGCPALQADPVLDGVAQRANSETQSYAEHTARFTPFEDPMPVLRELAYPAGKAKLLAGYGDSQEKAIYGAVLFGWEAIPDCTYTRYGADVLSNADQGYSLAAVVLVGG